MRTVSTSDLQTKIADLLGDKASDKLAIKYISDQLSRLPRGAKNFQMLRFHIANEAIQTLLQERANWESICKVFELYDNSSPFTSLLFRYNMQDNRDQMLQYAIATENSGLIDSLRSDAEHSPSAAVAADAADAGYNEEDLKLYNYLARLDKKSLEDTFQDLHKVMDRRFRITLDRMLPIAAKNKDLDTVEELIRVADEDKDFKTRALNCIPNKALIHAISNKDLPMVERLLSEISEEKVEYKLNPGGGTYVHLARGEVIVKYLEKIANDGRPYEYFGSNLSSDSNFNNINPKDTVVKQLMYYLDEKSMETFRSRPAFSAIIGEVELLRGIARGKNLTFLQAVEEFRDIMVKVPHDIEKFGDIMATPKGIPTDNSTTISRTDLASAPDSLQEALPTPTIEARCMTHFLNSLQETSPTTPKGPPR